MKNSFVLIGLVLLGTTSCKKLGCTDPTAQNYSDQAVQDDGSCTYAATTTPTAASPLPIIPTYSGEFGALIAIKTVTTSTTAIGTFDTDFGTAVAVFSANGGSTFVPAGTLTLTAGTTHDLTINSNNSYVHTPSATDILGVDYTSNGVSWTATGGAWSSFTATTNQGFPSVQVISSGDVTLSSAYTLTCGGVINADSVYYAVYGPSNSKLIVKAGNTSSHTFSASELSGLGTGSGFVQVTAVKYDEQTIGGKPHYLINETVRTKTVSLN